MVDELRVEFRGEKGMSSFVLGRKDVKLGRWVIRVAF